MSSPAHIVNVIVGMMFSGPLRQFLLFPVLFGGFWIIYQFGPVPRGLQMRNFGATCIGYWQVPFTGTHVQTTLFEIGR